MVAKFSPSGVKHWEYRIATNDTPYGLRQEITEIYKGTESIATDSHGDIYFTTRMWRTNQANPGTTLLVKLSGATGQELWRASEAHAVANGESCSAVAVGADNNVFFTGLIWDANRAGVFHSRIFVSKLSPNGKNVWRTLLPKSGYGLPAAGLGSSLATMKSGDVAVVGFRNGAGYASRLDAHGRLMWWSDDFRGDKQPNPYSSVLVGINESICATSKSGATVYSRRGRAIGTDAVFAGDASGRFRDGSYLLRYGTAFEKLAPNGRVRWRIMGGTYPIIHSLGGIPETSGGFITTGLISNPPASLGFVQFDSHANEVWQGHIAGYPAYSEYNRDVNFFLRAPDGTFRLVLNAGYQYALRQGISVLAFAIETALQVSNPAQTE